SLGSDPVPTIVGSSVVMASYDEYYAFDQLTGSSNHFFNGGGSGGGGFPVAFDSERMQFYVLDSINRFLTAYKYTSNSVISEIWRDATHAPEFGSVSIGVDGRIY